MPLQRTIPPDLEAIVRKRLSSGAFADANEVVRHALEEQDAEEKWTAEERLTLNRKIDRAVAQGAAGQVYSPDEARRKLAAMRDAHLRNQGR